MITLEKEICLHPLSLMGFHPPVLQTQVKSLGKQLNNQRQHAKLESKQSLGTISRSESRLAFSEIQKASPRIANGSTDPAAEPLNLEFHPALA